MCKKLLRIERPSHADLNRVISNSLVAALIPTAIALGGAGGGGGGGGGGGWSGGGGGGRASAGEMMHLGDKLAHLCPNRDFMFLQASLVPQVRLVDEPCYPTERGRLPSFC